MTTTNDLSGLIEATGRRIARALDKAGVKPPLRPQVWDEIHDSIRAALSNERDAAVKALREQDGMEYFGQRFDRAMDRYEAEKARADSLAARVWKLERALRTSPCPKMINDLPDQTVEECIRGGYCGCDNAQALGEQIGQSTK